MMNTPLSGTMIAKTPYPEVMGTRTGYVIRYTCPECAQESIIISTSARDHFRMSRVASCRHCRTRLNILTPGKDS